MRKIIILLLILGLWAASGAVLARDWSRYTSENFAIYSDAREKEVKAILSDFENFRRITLAIIGIPDQPENTKMQVLYFSSSREYRKIGSKNSIGFYTPTSAGPRMVVGQGRGSIDESAILYHEYIHYLFREHSQIVYPKWYDEGLAEVLGSTTIENGKATIGAVAEGRMRDLRYLSLLPIEELLAPSDLSNNDRTYASQFYASAWLFTHYLQISSFFDNQQFKAQTVDYLQRYNQGEDPIAAFAASFQMSPDDMYKQVARYGEKQVVSVFNTPVEDYEGPLEIQRLSTNEQVFLLADICWRLGKEELALDYLEDIDDDGEFAALPLSLGAVLENHDDENTSNQAKAEKAFALAPNNPQVLANIAHWEWDNHLRIEKTGKDTSNNVERAIQLGLSAYEKDPKNLEALYFLARAYRSQGKGVNAARAMMAAYQITPSSISLNFAIGQLLLQEKEYEVALPFLLRVRNWTHGEQQRAAVEKLIDEIKENLAENSKQ